MTTPTRSDLAHCTSMTPAQLAALQGSAIRLGRMKIGHFVLETAVPPVLWQKQKAGTTAATLVNVSSGPATAPTQVPYGNDAGTGLTSSADLTFDSVTKALATTIFSAGAYLSLATLTGFYMRLTGTPTANRIFTLPNVASDTFAMLAATQTLTNKTLGAVDAINNDIAFTASHVHETTVGIAAADMGVVETYGVKDAAGLETPLAAVMTSVTDATVGAIQSSFDLRVADGVSGADLGAGLRVRPEGAALARTLGAWIIPGSAGSFVQLTGYGAGAGVDVDLRARGAGALGSFAIWNPANTSYYVKVSAAGMGFYGHAEAIQPVVNGDLTLTVIGDLPGANPTSADVLARLNLIEGKVNEILDAGTGLRSNGTIAP